MKDSVYKWLAIFLLFSSSYYVLGTIVPQYCGNAYGCGGFWYLILAWILPLGGGWIIHKIYEFRDEENE